MPSEVLQGVFKERKQYKLGVDAPKYDKDVVISTISKMKKELAWHKKSEDDIRRALELFDDIHGDSDVTFATMALPWDRNIVRQMKLDLNGLLKKVLELAMRKKLHMAWWSDATNTIIKTWKDQEEIRAQRRKTLTARATFRASSMQLVAIREFAERRKLIIPSKNRGKFKRIKAYQSVHGVPAWPIGHRRGSSMTRVGLELHALRDLQEMAPIQSNAELSQQLNGLYEKLYELWETLKTRKLAREARALLKHKCTQLAPAQIQADYGCPWAVAEMLEMQQQRLTQNKQFNQIRNLRESVHINSPKMRMEQEELITEMSNLQRISDSMASDAMEREIKHQKASDIQRRSFQKGMKFKQQLQTKQSRLEEQLACDENIINELETEIADMLVDINKHRVRLKLPTFEIFVPIKDNDASPNNKGIGRKAKRVPGQKTHSKRENKENEEMKRDLIAATSPDHALTTISE